MLCDTRLNSVIFWQKHKTTSKYLLALTFFEERWERPNVDRASWLQDSHYNFLWIILNKTCEIVSTINNTKNKMQNNK